jgi:Lysozyme like domain
MSHLGLDDVAVLVLQRHFADPVVAVAIEWAEAGGDTEATHLNGDGSIDRGLWQINNRFHPEVSAAQAFDAHASTDAAYRLSFGGTVWTPWAVFNNGTYTRWIDSARAAVNRHIRAPWWSDWIGKPKEAISAASRNGVLTFPNRGWDVAYAQDVLRVTAGQCCQTTGTFDRPTSLAAANLHRFAKITHEWFQNGSHRLPVIGPRTWRLIDYLAETPK